MTIYDWLDESTKDILINMISERLQLDVDYTYRNENFINTGNPLKTISFTTTDAHYTLIIRKIFDDKIYFPGDFSKQLTGLDEQVKNHIIQEHREKQLNKIL